jgi:hypothetical protein
VVRCHHSRGSPQSPTLWSASKSAIIHLSTSVRNHLHLLEDAPPEEADSSSRYLPRHRQQRPAGNLERHFPCPSRLRHHRFPNGGLPESLLFFPSLAAIAHLPPHLDKSKLSQAKGSPQNVSIPWTKYFLQLIDSEPQKVGHSWRSETIQPAIIKLEIKKRAASSRPFRYVAYGYLLLLQVPGGKPLVCSDLLVTRAISILCGQISQAEAKKALSIRGGSAALAPRCPLQGVTILRMANKVDDTVNPRPRAVVCLSGGMDSAVCAALAARDFEAYALHFSYGQRTERRELESARAVAETLHFAKFLPLRIDIFRQIGGSALTDASIAVPDAPATEPIGESVPVTYVPFRNAHFLSAAVSWAEGAHWRRRTGQLRLSRLSSRLLPGLSATNPHRNSRRRHRSCHAAHPYAEE